MMREPTSRILSKKNFFKIIGIPPSFESFGMNARFGCLFLTKQVKSNMPQNSEIMIRVACTYTREIFMKSYVKNPVDAILDSPVTTHSMSKFQCITIDTQEIVAHLCCNFLSDTP